MYLTQRLLLAFACLILAVSKASFSEALEDLGEDVVQWLDFAFLPGAAMVRYVIIPASAYLGYSDVT